MKTETVKLLEESSAICDTGVGKEFLSQNPFTQELGSIIDQWDFMKLKTSAQLNERDEEEGQTRRETLCFLYISHKRTENKH